MNVISHNCPTCSASLTFDIDTQNWTCDYCKTAFTITELMNYHKNKKNIKSQVMHGYVCDNCGADIVTYDDDISSMCIYCNSPIIIKDRIEGDYKPDLISPFKHTKDDIIKEFLKLKSDRGLVPKKFFDKKNIVGVNGIYIPLFVVTCEVSASLRGDGVVNRNLRSSFIRKGTMQLKDVPADALSTIDDLYVRALEPFDYKQFKKFEYPYLAGMSAEAYDITKEEVYEKQIMERIAEAAYEQLLKSGKKYFSYEILSKEIKTFCSEFKHALVPIWCIHVKYDNKDYVYYVNDQNLKIAGTFPVSIIKETILYLFMILLNLFLIVCGRLFDAPISSLIIIGGTMLIWYICSSILLSYKKIKAGVKSRKYITGGSFIPIVSSDSDYSTR